VGFGGQLWTKQSQAHSSTLCRVECSLLHSTQTGSEAQPASCPTGTRDKAVGAWSWPLTSNQCQGQENLNLYIHSPIHLHGAVLDTSTETHLKEKSLDRALKAQWSSWFTFFLEPDCQKPEHSCATHGSKETPPIVSDRKVHGGNLYAEQHTCNITHTTLSSTDTTSIVRRLVERQCFITNFQNGIKGLGMGE
jgi:hypothetical protein